MPSLRLLLRGVVRPSSRYWRRCRERNGLDLGNPAIDINLDAPQPCSRVRRSGAIVARGAGALRLGTPGHSCHGDKMPIPLLAGSCDSGRSEKSAVEHSGALGRFGPWKDKHDPCGFTEGYTAGDSCQSPMVTLYSVHVKSIAVFSSPTRAHRPEHFERRGQCCTPITPSP